MRICFERTQIIEHASSLELQDGVYRYDIFIL